MYHAGMTLTKQQTEALVSFRRTPQAAHIKSFLTTTLEDYRVAYTSAGTAHAASESVALARAIDVVVNKLFNEVV